MTMYDDLVEAAARAVFDIVHPPAHPNTAEAIHYWNKGVRGYPEDMARAALDAILEKLKAPSSDMLEEAYEKAALFSPSEIWSAMLSTIKPTT